MIQSLSHVQTHRQHRMHVTHRRREWLIILFILVVALASFAFGYFKAVSWSDVILAVLITAYRLFVAYGIALALGLVIGLFVGWSRFSDYLFPVFDLLQNIPSFALIPLFIYFFGFTDEMIVLFAVTSIIWPILFSVLTAIKSAHVDLNDAATIFGARGVKRIFYYLAPLVFPAVLSGSIVGVAIGWETVIGAEIISNVSTGFGQYIRVASATGLSQASVVGVFVILLVVFEVNRLIWAPRLRESAKMYAE